VDSLTARSSDCACCRSRFTSERQLAVLPAVTVNNAPSPDARASTDDHRKVPLSVAYCGFCGHVQLTDLINPDFLYRGFRYTTITTLGMGKFFGHVTEIAKKLLSGRRKALAVDIGANDGTFLDVLGSGYKARVAIEPSKFASDICREKGLEVISTFFDYVVVEEVLSRFGRADFVFCANTFANIVDLESFLSALRRLMADGGMFCVATQDGRRVVNDTLIDTVYHEHIHYFSEQSLSHLLGRFGFRVVHREFNQQKGAGLLVFFEKLAREHVESTRIGELVTAPAVTRADFDSFVERVAQIPDAVNQCIARDKPEKIFGFGASVGATTLIAISELDRRLDGMLDDNPMSERFSWCDRWLPIYRASDFEIPEGRVLLVNFAYRYSEQIKAKNQSLLSRSNVIFRDFSEFISR
jgi:hypothetical protein